MGTMEAQMTVKSATLIMKFEGPRVTLDICVK